MKRSGSDNAAGLPAISQAALQRRSSGSISRRLSTGILRKSSTSESSLQKLYHKDTQSWHVYRVAEKKATDEGLKLRVLWGAGHVESHTYGGASQPLIEASDLRPIMPSCGFRLRTNGRVRAVVLKHKDGILYVLCDGSYANATAFDSAQVKKNGAIEVHFKMTVPGEQRRVSAAVQMIWRKQQWEYVLSVNSIKVPACWMGTAGYNHLIYTPEVIDLESNCRGLDMLFNDKLPRGLKVEQTFYFSMQGLLRTMAFCRADILGRDWNVLLDGEMAAKLTPASQSTAEFEVSVPGRCSAIAKVLLAWEGYGKGWACALQVNNVHVPPSLSLDDGTFCAMHSPEVIDVEKNAIDPNKLMTNSSISDASLHFVQTFQFATQGQLRGVAIAHSHHVWAIICDGIQVQRFQHTSDLFQDREEQVKFEVPLQNGRQLHAVATMNWHLGVDPHWKYHLEVNGILLQNHWSRSEGEHCVPLLEVERPEESLLEVERSDELGQEITAGEMSMQFADPTESGSKSQKHIDLLTRSMSKLTRSMSKFHDSESDAVEENSVFEEIFPYTVGEYVEYYSWSNRKWLLAIFRGQQDTTEGYVVDIVRGHRRFHIHLDCLRLPFQADELVEVFSHCKGWLPGKVSGQQDPSKATRRGYKVQLNGRDDAAFARIPAERLRRRFPAGVSAEVWSGPTMGWVLATIHEKLVSEDGCGSAPWLENKTPAFLKFQRERELHFMSSSSLEPLKASTAGHNAVENRMIDSVMAAAAEREGLAASLASNFPSIESQLDPWTAVPVMNGSFSGPDSVDTLPLYLLRNVIPETWC